jgi:cysteine desulfurase
MMEKNKQIIYFDNNASTQVDKRVLEAIMPYLTYEYGNPNSTHQLGLNAYSAVQNARIQVSNLIDAEPNEIVFTSGSTEAINLGIKGVAEKYTKKGKHIITVSTEHSAVLDTCKNLESKGYEVTILPVRPDGILELDRLEEVLRSDTILVSVMYVNNEIGVIQPVKQVAELCHKFGALFLCDATQAIGKIPVNVDDIGIDLMCLSGHKFYAPKGIGALYVRNTNNKVHISALLHGGGHEGGLRSGTLNVPGIVSLGAACEIAKIDMGDDAKRISILRDKLERNLLEFNGTYVNGSKENRMYNISNICFKGIDANILIGRLKNIAVSNGSACTSSNMEPSHVLKAIGLSDDDAYSTIRFSLGRFNTENEVHLVLNTFNNYLHRTQSE